MNRLTDSSLFQLVATRFKLFFREPEAVFWIFVFPLLLALGLSIAFRNRPADVLQVAGTTPQLTQALQSDKGLTAVTVKRRGDGRWPWAGSCCSRCRFRRPRGRRLV